MRNIKAYEPVSAQEDSPLRIAIGSDHAGFELKEEIAKFLREEKLEFHDFGTFSLESVDYPDIAAEVAQAINSGKFDLGILVCGTGVGMCIAANKFKGIRAAHCSDEYTARLSREHNNANVLALGGRTIGIELAKSIVKAWLNASFDDNSRHSKRVDKIKLLEENQN